MSSALKKNKRFLSFLLDKNTPLNQKRAVIFTASETQLTAVAEIIFNISAGVLPLPKKTRELLQKHRLLIQKANKAKGKAKLKFLRAKYNKVCDLLLSVRNIILDLIA
ncbi:MAG: hypothetical protein AB2541_15230 [Candidatus Thiodiazotropha sp.]